MSSPITSWEGATTYFTFADNPLAMAVCLAAAVGVFVYLNVSIIRHEKAVFDKHLSD
ncbi:hypothetical protein [Nitrincola tapanii]|jgi:hypothetical protein|uniref:hypothetical protein n=1 Tax=Nitrincola tapanii TaxID=1708751 RepID=UPI00190F0B33|nr:hypothetical protein [Nitrincola tapanii]